MADNEQNIGTESQLSAVDRATIFEAIIRSAGTVLDFTRLTKQLAESVCRALPCTRTVILTMDDEITSLRFAAGYNLSLPPQTQPNPKTIILPLYDAPIINAWLQGETRLLDSQTTAEYPELNAITALLQSSQPLSAPLHNDENLMAVLIAASDTPPPDFPARLEAAAQAASIAMINSLAYTRTVQQAEANMRELTILRQIDRELNDTIEPQHVVSMTLDWALRFTNAQAASIGIYDQDTDDYRIIADYGYDIARDQLALVRAERGGIGHRVARSGFAEVIPDVSLDKDFIRGASITRSQISVPVMREDRVIAVINVESKKINGFDDEQLDFVEKLAARAGVAIDNARLFDTTVREHEKLSHILNNIADIVIVFGLDERIVLINPAAMTALRLDHEIDYTGLNFREVLATTALTEAYERAKTTAEPLIEEIQLSKEQTFHLNITRSENVGWIIVMHDITLFKEMDQLKSELIATVSHDLKQPLAVMNGYIELLLMHGKMDETGQNFIDMVRKSVLSMRQLIDDLLDLAKIESGVRLNLEAVNVRDLVGECVDALQPAITTKAMSVEIDIPKDLPPLMADRSRLQQIMLNLIGNGVKYTPSNGRVNVRAEHNEAEAIHLFIEDNGMGISPEDQAHIFERFYRVRRPETDSIEGTGLGLAIVKSLVEAHHGKISLKSRPGQGTTFCLTMPAASTD